MTEDEARIKIVERIAEQFLGTVEINEKDNTFNIIVAKEYENECAVAVANAMEQIDQFQEFLDNKNIK